jgi:hypothetical protein
MAGVRKLSEQVIEAAERAAAVSDAAQGRRARRGGLRARWLILPAAGAGIYALVTSRSFPRQARGVLQQAKDRASDLPEDLVGRVQQATGDGRKSGGRPARKTSSRKSTSGNTRKTTSAR